MCLWAAGMTGRRQLPESHRPPGAGYWLINPTLHINLLYTVSTNLTLCYSALWPASLGAMQAYQHRRSLCRRLAVCA
jgi:hypothetical protein